MTAARIPVWLPVLMVLGFCLAGFATGYTDLINWGFAGVTRAKEWVSPDGRLDLQNQLPNTSTAIDCWPTPTVRPTADSLCEVTLNRYQWDAPGMERMNWSAMVDQTDGGAYRFGVERGGTGQFRPVLFCFENVTPGVSSCPLKIDEYGVYAMVNGAYRPLATN